MTKGLIFCVEVRSFVINAKRSRNDAAKLFKCSRQTITKICKDNFEWAPTKRVSQTLQARIKDRRREIKALANIKCRSRTGARTWKKHGSAYAIGKALQDVYGRRASQRTVRRDLKSMNMVPYVRKPVPTRSRIDLAAQRVFKLYATPINHRLIIFSDETFVTTNERTGNVEWCKKGKRPYPIEKKANRNAHQRMVWAAIGYNYKSPLVILPCKCQDDDGEQVYFRLNSDEYIRRCLTQIVPHLQANPTKLFMQDGARCHTAKKTMAYLETNKKVSMLKHFPPYSPILNPIEKVWKELHDRVGAKCPETEAQLLVAVQEAWAELPQQVINNHIDHFKTVLATI